MDEKDWKYINNFVRHLGFDRIPSKLKNRTRDEAMNWISTQFFHFTFVPPDDRYASAWPWKKGKVKSQIFKEALDDTLLDTLRAKAEEIKAEIRKDREKVGMFDFVDTPESEKAKDELQALEKKPRYEGQHRDIVRMALKAGMPVPTDVVEEYSDEPWAAAELLRRSRHLGAEHFKQPEGLGIGSLPPDGGGRVETKATIVDYYDWEEESDCSCPHCGWKGKYSELPGNFDSKYSMDYTCPSCSRMMVVIGYPTIEETKAAAAKGKREALLALPGIRYRELRQEEFERTKLKNATQLPDIEGDNLRFTWDLLIENKEPYVTIKLGDILIWKEVGFFECVWRFNQVKDILKAKYSTGFKRLTPTERSETYLFGDDLRAPSRIQYE